MGSCAAPSAKGDDKFITTDYLQKGMISLSPPTICNSANAGLFLFVASLLAFIGLHSRMYCGYALYSPVYYLPVSHPAAGGTRQPAAA
ncbi:hypothetical protein D0Y48_00005 (plasmid) [Klebsiella quasipneumoniae]|nr:hypothetical protein [Klebsiella quasipneumoniae]